LPGQVANLVCSMSNNEDGVKMVRYAAAQIENLCPQVINAARVWAARNSEVAKDNMKVFRQAWENQMRVLTEAVDDITTIDDFLAVSENHILDDVNKCVLALQVRPGDADTLDRHAGAILGRSARVVNVVQAEMDNYEPCIYTKRVLEAVKVLRKQVMPNFEQRVEEAVNALRSNPAQEVDENDFIDASRLVYDGVREIRRAVLMNRVRDSHRNACQASATILFLLFLIYFHFFFRRTKIWIPKMWNWMNTTRWRRAANLAHRPVNTA